MMIVWRGWGILTLVIAAVSLGLVGMMTPVPQDAWTFRWHAAVALLIGAVVNFFVGWQLNRRSGRLHIDGVTGLRFKQRTRHDLFFIPIEYWTVAFVLGAAAMLLAR
jgi:hypothetical protein